MTSVILFGHPRISEALRFEPRSRIENEEAEHPLVTDVLIGTPASISLLVNLQKVAQLVGLWQITSIRKKVQDLAEQKCNELLILQVEQFLQSKTN